MLKAVRAFLLLGGLMASIVAPCAPALAIVPACDMPDCGNNAVGAEAGHECCCAAPGGPVEPARAKAEPGPQVKPVPVLWMAEGPEAVHHGFDTAETDHARPSRVPPLHLLNASFLL